MPRHSKSLPRGQLIESPMVCRAHVCYFPHLFIVADRQKRMLWGVSYHWRILVTISRRPNTPIQTPIRQYLSQMRKQSLFFSLTSQITKNVCCRRALHIIGSSTSFLCGNHNNLMIIHRFSNKQRPVLIAFIALSKWAQIKDASPYIQKSA